MTLSLAARVVLGIGGIAAVLSGSLGIVLAVVIADALIFSGVEAVLFGLAYDLLWVGTGELLSPPWVTLCALAMLWASEPLRREILA